MLVEKDVSQSCERGCPGWDDLICSSSFEILAHFWIQVANVWNDEDVISPASVTIFSSHLVLRPESSLFASLSKLG